MSRIRVIGGWMAIGVLIISFAVAWHVGRGSPAAQGAAAIELDVVDEVTAIEAGRLLYLETCASCHGEDGRGLLLDVPGDEAQVLGPSLEDSGAASWHFYLTTGRMPLSAPGEPAYRQPAMFSDEEIAVLVAYGASLWEGPDIPTVVSDGADLQAGWHLYVNNCAACHGVTGTGGAVGPGSIAPNILDVDPTILGEAILVGPGTMPRFAWNDEQLSAVAAYVETLREGPDPGGLSVGGFGPVPEGLIAGFVGLAVLVLVARFVAGQPPQEQTEPGAPPPDLEPGAPAEDHDSRASSGGDAPGIGAPRA